MTSDETTRLRALLERAELPACEAGRDRGDNLCVYQTGRHQWTVAEVSDSPDASDDAIEARAHLFAAIPTALPGLLDAAERAERERADLAATLETRTAEHSLAMARVRELEARLTAAIDDHAVAEEHLAAIVSRWEAADHDAQSLADLHVPGLRAEIEDARDGREGEWWEVSRG